MKPARGTAVWLAAFVLFAAFGAQALVSCSALPPWLTALGPTQTPGLQSTPTPTQPTGEVRDPTPFFTPEPPSDLTIWLPPEFNPAGSGKAAGLLQQRLEAFSQANSVKINIRLKAPSGPGGLIESLSTAAAAAPMALPSLTALSRSDMETAALKGLLTSLDGFSTASGGDDWYEYARQLARVQGATFGLPFAGDALLVVYRPTQISPSPASWDSILNLKQPFAFPAANPQALATIALYRSTGGEIEDAQGRPVLDADSLTQVFELYAQAAQDGVFPAWLAQVDLDSQVWQAYAEGRAADARAFGRFPGCCHRLGLDGDRSSS
jgi:ABC-type glycerol-3-phosphate transport system substrate-binding protein